MTSTGIIVGTPSYMSPEQGMGQLLDGRSDIYSLGVILYELVIGHVPFRAETPMAVVFKHIQDPLPPPRKIDPSISEAIERVILKSLAKKPEDRYATPADMVKALQMAIQVTTSIQQAGSITPATRYTRISQKTQPVSNPSTKAPIPPTPTAAAPNQSGSNQMMLWAMMSLLLITVIGLALLGVWWFSRPGQAVEIPPTPTQVQQPTVERKQLELPQATPTLPPTPAPTPPPPAANQAPPTPSQPQPPAPQPPSGQFPAPPPEAIEACRGAAAGAACTANTQRGVVTGTCQTPPRQQQLACIPAGGGPPAGP